MDGRMPPDRPPLHDKAIAALTIHLHVGNQSAFEERTEMPEHAIVGQFRKRRTGEICGIAHEQYVRKIVSIQSLNCVFGDGQSLAGGLKCTTLVHRAYLDSHLL